ncbi:MAG TPA: acyl-CoA dehydrogenase family protein [Acidimicrobiales bacterium]|nr:acyl-CoA dehydrogenase family protein [Acidimicrobiales bacterium]
MDFDLEETHAHWLAEVRTFLAEHFSAGDEEDARRGGGEWSGPMIRRFRRQLAERDWLALTWPEEEGGLAKSMVEQVLFMDALGYAGAPSIDMTASSVAPAIIRSGTPAQLERWLPPIRAGEVEFAVGYSEPDAGSDLASLQTRAVRDGDEWVINGEKIWNTGAEYCTHEWLACRTDPDASPHRGISVLIVPIETPGITVHGITTWRGMRTNQVAFSDVRVPADHLVGGLHEGWRVITQALDFERVAIGITGGLRRLFEGLVDHCRKTVVDGRPLGARPEVATALARLAVDLELARLLNYRAAAMIDAGQVPHGEASMTKVFTTELHARMGDTATEVLGLAGQLDPYDEGAPLGGLAQLVYRAAPYLRFGGGTNEIQRDIIAQQGFGLPRRS